MENSVLVTMYLSENFRKQEFIKNGSVSVPTLIKDNVILSFWTILKIKNK